MVDVSEIERRVDRAITATIPVTRSLGGIDPKDYGQVMEFAKTMATCRAGIPQWLRASPGDCLMICSRAMRWGMDPYFVAEKSYLMQNNRTGETRVGYESQLIHAVVESSCPAQGQTASSIRGRRRRSRLHRVRHVHRRGQAARIHQRHARKAHQGHRQERQGKLSRQSELAAEAAPAIVL